LRTRPSLFDLVQKKNIDQISTSGSHIPATEDDVQPHRVPLPQSPLISPQIELPSQPTPPHITLQEASDDEKDTAVDKMPPVSISGVEGPERRQLTSGAQKAQKKQEQKSEAEEHGKLAYSRYAHNKY
jgi:V-type H+-transporting ATPase subunit A